MISAIFSILLRIFRKSYGLNYKEFRGFVIVDNYAPFVFINGSDFKSAQMFTLARSEEHTSELQSHSFISYAVFCLKKKK